MSIVFSHQNFSPPKRCPPCLIIFIEIYIWCHHKLFPVSWSLLPWMCVIIAGNSKITCLADHLSTLNICKYYPLPILVGTLTLSCCRVQNSGRSTNYLWFNMFVLCEGRGRWNLLRCDVMDICLAKNGLRPSKNTFDRITWPGSAGTFIRVLYCNLNRLIEACEILS